MHKVKIFLTHTFVCGGACVKENKMFVGVSLQRGECLLALVYIKLTVLGTPASREAEFLMFKLTQAVGDWL